MKGTTSQVDDLKAKLAAQEQELAVKNDEANKLIQVVGAETDKVNDVMLLVLQCKFLYISDHCCCHTSL